MVSLVRFVWFVSLLTENTGTLRVGIQRLSWHESLDGISDNITGTLNFQPRVHKFDILFTPNASATVENPSGKNLFFWYKETIRFYGPDGQPVSHYLSIQIGVETLKRTGNGS